MDLTEKIIKTRTFQETQAELERLSGHERWIYWLGKRAFDICVSLLAIIALLPFFLLIALAIQIDSPGAPSFYQQVRVGRRGKTFTMWKFRSMVKDADKMLVALADQNEKDGPVFKIRDDPRITRIGKFIRRTSIDELPQLWNVLKGDMSFVGPRPALPSEVLKYNPVQRERLLVTPGLTCYWQVSKNRDTIGFDEWVEMDIQYIYDRSWLLDLKLIFKTFAVMLTGQGQ